MIAFEPHPSNLFYFSRSIQINVARGIFPKNRIKLYPYAVGEVEGCHTIFSEIGNMGNAMLNVPIKGAPTATLRYTEGDKYLCSFLYSMVKCLYLHSGPSSPVVYHSRINWSLKIILSIYLILLMILPLSVESITPSALFDSTMSCGRIGTHTIHKYLPSKSMFKVHQQTN